jgi:hypothetical protein
MITSLGIEKFWEHINEIERNIDAGTSFPPYNIIRHDERHRSLLRRRNPLCESTQNYSRRKETKSY